MTLREVTNQIIELSPIINREKFTKERLYKQCASMFRPEAGELKVKNSLIYTITLPDGVWYFKITQYAPGQFDYEIPETRKREQQIKDMLFR